jgi:NAD-dependent SIR2 family protein deacetylase
MSQSTDQQILTSVPPLLQEKLDKAYSIAVLAGAGVSAAGGAPIFRGPHQMKYFCGWPPAYICSAEMLNRSPIVVWQFLKHYHELLKSAKPGPANETLAAWQREARRRRVVQLYLLDDQVFWGEWKKKGDLGKVLA